MTHPTYGLIGRGRMAFHIARYLELENRTVFRWHRGMPAAPDVCLGDADIILLAINDDAIGPFVENHPELDGRKIVHFCGSRSFQGLVGLHPLMSFGLEPYDLETYRSIPFISEKGGAGFSEIFPGLSNPCREIPRDTKALYHALCVLGGNCPALLWSAVTEAFETRLGLPGDFLAPYLRQVAENFERSGTAALTGPLIRADGETLKTDLEALQGNPWQGVLRSFVNLFEGARA